MFCNLYDAHEDRPTQIALQTALAGTLVSSLHRLKDINNNGWSIVLLTLCTEIDGALADGGFFVFGDLSVKVEGEYRLQFGLFDMRK